MKTTHWIIQGKKYRFPKNWDKTQVLQFANTDIKVCFNCGKVDCGLDHFDNCNPQEEQIRQDNLEYYE